MIDPEFDLRLMPAEELEKVPFDTMYWCCQGKKCGRRTKVKTYGDFPFFMWRKTWIKIDNGFPANFFMCAKHFRMWKHLKKNYPEDAVFQRIMKPYRMSLM